MFFLESLGLLLREIKDFWRAALLLSTLIYPAYIDSTTNSPIDHFELGKRIELFKKVEDKVRNLGIINFPSNSKLFC